MVGKGSWRDRAKQKWEACSGLEKTVVVGAVVVGGGVVVGAAVIALAPGLVSVTIGGGLASAGAWLIRSGLQS